MRTFFIGFGFFFKQKTFHMLSTEEGSKEGREGGNEAENESIKYVEQEVKKIGRT